MKIGTAKKKLPPQKHFFILKLRHFVNSSVQNNEYEKNNRMEEKTL